MTIQLCPAQQQAQDRLLTALPVGNVFVLWGHTGSGTTTVLQEVQRTTGGALLSLKDFVNAMRSRHPLALEETFAQLVMDALAANSCVVVDDLELLSNVTNGCGSYPRTGFLDAPLTVLTTYAAEAGKKLIFGRGSHIGPVHQRCYSFGIGEFTIKDYIFFCETWLGPAAARLDYEEIFRYAPKLNAHQLKAACIWLRREDELTTERFLGYLRSQYLASNVDLNEVQAMNLHDLKGVDEVIRDLEANIILPLENHDLARELGLKPKRGVLLAGPPGTGKTSVGRALAHRLQSKFFLLDGTGISGTNSFYYHILSLVEQAKHNAPSILFIDDSDAIFQSGEELGLYRYLLTMLDGLESASSGRVCVMLTAMDISHLPPALIRSGRIELWLEMKLPDARARADILTAQMGSAASLDGQLDVQQVAARTDGFTGADLKRLVEDGKLLLAADRAASRPLRPVTDYFLTAIETILENRQRYAEAEARARTQRARNRSGCEGN
jgi:ATP-dependent 26S proteasome regulatory subunit